MKRSVVIASALAALATPIKPVRAADARLKYHAEASAVYSQDVLRTGERGQDDYLSNLSFGLGLDLKTPRSVTTLEYSPDYLRYDRFRELDHLDHRFAGQWRLRPGPRSGISLRQGFALTSRQSGFQDYAGAGGNASEPVIGVTKRRTLDLSPRWEMTPTARASWSAEGLYRAERYDRADLVDSDQFGLQASMEARTGRFQSLGGRVRGDSYRFFGARPAIYDRFVNAQATWSTRTGERVNLLVAGGAFRGSGQGVDPIAGPTADVEGTWHWKRSDLGLRAGVGYSSGGGISYTDRTQEGSGEWHTRWGRGYGLGVNLAYFRRRSIGGQTTSDQPLYGRSSGLSLTRAWPSGSGLSLGLLVVRQDRQTGRALSYGEFTAAYSYHPPEPVRRAPSGP